MKRPVFDALGDPTRRRILELLSDGEQSVTTLVTALSVTRPLSQPAVSQHLRVLRDAGLVRVRADGTRRLYRLVADGVDDAVSWLESLRVARSAFDQPLDALETEVRRGRRARTNRDPRRGQAATAG